MRFWPIMQRIEILQVGMPLEENDPGRELVRMLHLLDQFLALLLGEPREAPVIQEAVVQPVLANRRQLVFQGLVQDVDDFLLTLHGQPPPLPG